MVSKKALYWTLGIGLAICLGFSVALTYFPIYAIFHAGE